MYEEYISKLTWFAFFVTFRKRNKTTTTEKIDKTRFVLPAPSREMLTVSNRASEDFLAAFDFNYNESSGVDSLAVYGNKPNAIVRPLQHNEKEPSKDGLVLTDLESQIIPETPSRLDVKGTGYRIGSDSELNKEDFFSRQLDQKLRLFDFSKDSSRNVCETYLRCDFFVLNPHFHD